MRALGASVPRKVVHNVWVQPVVSRTWRSSATQSAPPESIERLGITGCVSAGARPAASKKFVGLRLLQRFSFAALLLALWATPLTVEAQGVFVRADCNDSNDVDISDAIFLLNFLFVGNVDPVACSDACDANDSENLDISDGIYLLNWLFVSNSPAPPPPHPGLGVDPTTDPLLDLPCENGRDPPAELLVVPGEVIFHVVGETLHLSIVAVDDEGTTTPVEDLETVSFSSTQPEVVQIDALGVLTATGVGEAVVSVLFRTVETEVTVRVRAGADGAPLLDVVSPPNGAEVSSAMVLVSGVVSDADAALTVNGTPVAHEGSFSTLIDVALGDSDIVVEATNAMGSAVETVRVVRVEPGEVTDPITGEPLPTLEPALVSDPDTTPPGLTVSQPTAGANLLSGVVTVIGDVDDLAATVDINGVRATVDGAGSFSAVVRLAPGPQAILVVARDPVGNSGELSIPVDVDDTLPVITIDTPSGDPSIVVASSQILMSGSVTPSGSAVMVNGLSAQVTGSTWQMELSLPAGVHDVVATAQSGTLKAHTSRSLVVDTAGPRVEVLFPPSTALESPSGHSTEETNVRISGRVWDLGGAPRQNAAIDLTVAGVVAAIAGDTFTVDVPLAIGTNDLALVATDGRGNETARNLRVVRGNDPAPAIVLLGAPVRTVNAGTPLPQLLAVRLDSAAGTPLVGRPVIFDVLGGDGSFPGGERRTEVDTDGAGEASVSLSPGVGAGAASHVVEIRAVGVLASPKSYVIEVIPSLDTVLVPHGPRHQTAALGGEAPQAFGVRVLDRFGSELADESIAFRVIDGPALIDGVRLTVRTTDAMGVASVRASVPSGEESTSTIQASRAGVDPVRFTLRGVAQGAATDTSLSGFVADERGEPYAGVSVRLVGWPGEPGLAVTTGTDGAFVIAAAPVGVGLVEVGDPTETFGSRFRAETIAGRSNWVGQLSLERSQVDSPRRRSVSLFPGRDVLATLEAVPGLRFELAAGGATLPGGADAMTIALSAPHLDALPGRVSDALHPLGAISILPVQVQLTGLELALPQLHARAGELVPLFEYRAAHGGFVEMQPGLVSDDRLAVRLLDSAQVSTGGFYIASRRGPPLGEVGSVSGGFRFARPGWNEVGARSASHVAGFQVYSHSGEFYLDEIDLEIPGRGLPYRLRRRYESRHRFEASLGHNWEHEYEDRRLLSAFVPGNVVRADGAGRFDEFLLDSSSGSFVSPIGVFARLFVDSEGFYVERLSDGTRYRYHPLDATGTAGRLESISDRSGNQLTFARGGDGLIDTVRDTLGRTIVYQHDSRGRVESVTDFTGRSVVFEYDSRGDLVAVTRPAVVGTPSGNDFPAGKRTEYIYTTGFADERSNHNLTQIIDPRQTSSTDLPRVTVLYEDDPSAAAFDRVVTQQWGGTNDSGVAVSGSVEFAYELFGGGSSGAESDSAAELESFLLGAQGMTTITTDEGFVTEFTWSGAGLPLEERVITSPTLDAVRPRDPSRAQPPPGVAPPFYATRWQWSREGLLLARTDPGGERVVFTYDESAPLRSAQNGLVREERHGAPGAASLGLDSTPSVAVKTYRRDPLYGVAIEVVPPRGNAAGAVAGDFRRTFFMDYQEGASVAQLAMIAGASDEQMAAALAHAGVALGLGDLNGDGSEVLVHGNIVREVLPPTPRPDGSSAESVRQTRFNAFGQVTRTEDADGRSLRYEYHPENDPEGDGSTTPGGDLDGSTGGFLARRIVEDASELVTSFDYDVWGFLARVVDPQGNERFLVHNALGQLVEERLPVPLRYRRQFLYDADDHLELVQLENFSATDAGVSFLVSDNRWLETSAEYDLLGRPVRIVREVFGGEDGVVESVTVELRYNRAGRLVELQNLAAGRNDAWTHDERGLVVQHARGVGSPEEDAVTFLRDAAGRVVETIDAADLDGDGEAERKREVRDGFGRVIAAVDALGSTHLFARDVEGHVTDEFFFGTAGGESPTGAATGGAPTDFGRVLLERGASSYDARGRVAESVAWRFGALDLAANPVTESHRRQFWYDDSDRVVREDDSAAGVSEWAYDAAGRLEEARSGGVSRTTYVRDANGNAVREVRELLTPDVLATPGIDDPDYDVSGQFRETQNIVRIFDELNRLKVLVDPAGGVWRQRFDSAGNRLLISDAKGSSLNVENDPELAPHESLLSAVQLAQLNATGNRLRFRYDNLRRPVLAQHELRRDGEGGASLDTTNPFNRDGLIEETYEYDDDGRLAAWTDDTGRRVDLTYNAAGRVQRKTWEDGSFADYERDADGTVRAIVDGNGTRFEHTFDAGGRVVERRVERAAGISGTTLQRFQYDGLGRPTFFFDNNDPDDQSDDASVQVAYDSFGNVVSELVGNRSVEAHHNLTGARLWLRYPDGRVVTAARDSLNRVTGLEDSSVPLASYRHFGSGLLREKSLWNGVGVAFVRPDGDGIDRMFGYDAAGELVEITYSTAGGELLRSFEYGRDRSGFREYELPLHSAELRGDVWRYDSTYFLKSFFPNVFNPRSPPAAPLEKIVFFTDGNFNWRFLEVDFSIVRIAVSELRDFYIDIDEEEFFTYDGAGNFVGTDAVDFVYDAFGRLLDVQRDGVSVARSKYDAYGCHDAARFRGRGRRTAKNVIVPVNFRQPTGELAFLHFGDDLIEERRGGSVRQYIFEELYKRSGEVERRPAFRVFRPEAGAAFTEALIHDSSDSVSAVLGADAAIIESVAYDAYGKPTVRNAVGSPLAFSTVENVVTFGSHYHDFEVGMHLVGARHFDPQIGRYLTPDDGVFPTRLGLNAYLQPRVRGLAGRLGGVSRRLQADYLEPFRMNVVSKHDILGACLDGAAGPCEITGADVRARLFELYPLGGSAERSSVASNARGGVQPRSHAPASTSFNCKTSETSGIPCQPVRDRDSQQGFAP